MSPGVASHGRRRSDSDLDGRARLSVVVVLELVEGQFAGLLNDRVPVALAVRIGEPSIASVVKVADEFTEVELDLAGVILGGVGPSHFDSRSSVDEFLFNDRGLPVRSQVLVSVNGDGGDKNVSGSSEVAIAVHDVEGDESSPEEEHHDGREDSGHFRSTKFTSDDQASKSEDHEADDGAGEEQDQGEGNVSGRELANEEGLSVLGPVVDSRDGPGETESNEDGSGIGSSESGDRSIGILGALAFGGTSGGSEVGKRSTNSDQDKGLDGGSHVEDASNSGGNLEDEEGNSSDGSEGTGGSHVSVHVAARGNGSHSEFPRHGSVLDKGLSGGDLFGVLGIEVSGLLELLGVGELSRLVQEFLKAGTEGNNLFIFLLRSDLDHTLGGGEFGLLGGKFKLDSSGLFVLEGGNLNFDGGLNLAVGKHDRLLKRKLFSLVATQGSGDTAGNFTVGTVHSLEEDLDLLLLGSSGDHGGFESDDTGVSVIEDSDVSA